MLNKMRIEIDKQTGHIIYDGITLDLTTSNLEDYCSQTGQGAEVLIDFYYKNHPEYKARIRDSKLGSILNEKTT